MSATKRIVNIAPGATVHATLAYHDAVTSSTPSCKAIPATLIRAYPPDQTAYTQGFDSLPSCRGSVVYMGIGVIQPGL
jgi:glutamine cyclotransferase